MLKIITTKLLNPTGLVIAKPTHIVLFSFLMCALFLVAVLSLFPVHFDTLDDHLNMYMLAGYYAGTPHPFVIFSNMVFGYMVAGLYTLFPMLPCYAIFLIFVIFVSAVVISYCISETAKKYNVPFIFCILFVLLFLFGFALQPFVMLQYTTVSGFAGAAAIALAITLTPSSERRPFIRYALIVALCVLSFIIRPQSFYPVVPILGGTLCFKMLKNPKKNILYREEFILIVALAITIISLHAFSAHKTRIMAGEDFVEWARYIQPVMDYTNFDRIDPNEVGVSREELNIIRNWNFLTENIGTPLFKKIASLDDAHIGLRSGISRDKIVYAFKLYMAQFTHPMSVMYFYITLLLLFVFAIFMRYFILKEKKTDILKSLNVSNISLCVIFILYFALNVYLCLGGRYPMRVYITMNLLLAPVIIMMLCALYGKLTQRIIRTVAAILLVVCMFWGIHYVRVIAKTRGVVRREQILNVMEEYAINNPHNFYVFSSPFHTAISSPFKVMGTQRPTNLMFWGLWHYFSPVWHKQLEVNGMENLNYASFLKDNVFFITNNPTNPGISHFILYAEDRFKDVGGRFVIADAFNIHDENNVLNAILVLKFITEDQTITNESGGL